MFFPTFYQKNSFTLLNDFSILILTFVEFMIFLFSFFIIGIGGKKMNYLHVIELINQMEEKVIQAKLITYTKKSFEKEL